MCGFLHPEQIFNLGLELEDEEPDADISSSFRVNVGVKGERIPPDIDLLTNLTFLSSVAETVCSSALLHLSVICLGGVHVSDSHSW